MNDCIICKMLLNLPIDVKNDLVQYDAGRFLFEEIRKIDRGYLQFLNQYEMTNAVIKLWSIKSEIEFNLQKFLKFFVAFSETDDYAFSNNLLSCFLEFFIFYFYNLEFDITKERWIK